jgi:predicted amino acid racemase
MYPRLYVHKDRTYNNAKAVVTLCAEQGIDVTGVVKGCSGNIAASKAVLKAGVKHVGSSRMSQIEAIKREIPDAKTLMLRIPMISEIEKLVTFCDYSLQSEYEIIELVEHECHNQGKTHDVILMMDLGDLREGYMNEDEIISVAEKIENGLKYVKLAGIGTNVGCYGSVKATPDNLGKLVEIAYKIEALIGRKLDIVSGGATSSLPLVVSGEMPSGINHLRIGEGLLTCREVAEFYHSPIKGQTTDAFILEAEIVEIKTKPTYPMGELAYDAFGNKPSFEDRGIKKRMLLAVGRQDFGQHEKLVSLDETIEIIGSSSDHLIVEVSERSKDYRLGDTIRFEIMYPAMLYLTGSPDVFKVDV